MRRRLGSLCLAIAAFTAAVAHAAPAGSKGTHKLALSKSVGAPNEGKLVSGVHLESSPSLRVVPAYVPGDARWGVRELVELIESAAHEVKKRYPDAVLGVGHLSRKDGGEIDRHHSHESGRDADLAFYLSDVAGRPVRPDRFLAILPNGIAAADSHVRFDDGRNWALVSALVSDPHAHVTHIFVVQYLRTRLLAYAARVGASPALRARVAEVLMQPHHALPHDDHFHVRIGCPTTSSQCVEWPVSGHVAKKPGTIVAKARLHAPKPPTKKLVRARSTGHAPAQLDAKPAPEAAPSVTPDLPPVAPPQDPSGA